LVSILAAFPDRVARRRSKNDIVFAAGGSAQLAANSTVTAAEFLVAIEAENRLVRLASAIEPEWLLDLFPDRVRETSRLEWNRTAERVESVTGLEFGEIAIQETRGVPPDPEASAAMLAEKGLEAGLAKYADPLAGRVTFAAQHAAIPPLDIPAALRSLAFGLTSLRDLDAAASDGLVRALEGQLPRALDEIAPERIRLPRGRQVVVHYDPGQPPWIASRLQDFFGMTETPTIARGTVPLVVRLLAPNQRPVQTTTDLAGFWTRLYPQLRKELSRRYPKHQWPAEPRP